MSNEEEFVFPLLEKSAPKDGVTYYDGQPGLTKREYFAGLAMQGIVSGGYNLGSGPKYRPDPESCASYSLQYADALLAELAKENK